MTSLVMRIIACAMLIMFTAPQASTHDATHVGDTSTAGPTTDLVVTLVPDGEPQVVRVARGDNVRLSVVGAGAHELHLHGYDIEVEGRGGAPAVFRFHATHSGRFPVVTHGETSLLGETERTILYIEVREQ